VKAVLTDALGEDVEVDLVQAIGRGDGFCEFVVQPAPPRSSRSPGSREPHTAFGDGTGNLANQHLRPSNGWREGVVIV
jgi:hypothetical protein